MCALSKKDYLFRKTDCKLLSRRVSFDKKKVYPKRISEAGGAQYIARARSGVCTPPPLASKEARRDRSKALGSLQTEKCENWREANLGFMQLSDWEPFKVFFPPVFTYFMRCCIAHKQAL